MAMPEPTEPPSRLPAPATVTTDNLAALLAHINEVVCSFDEAGLVVFTSPAIRTYLGYEPDELVGRPVIELMHPDDLAEFADRWELALSKAGPTLQPNYRVLHADGSWVRVTVDFYVGDVIGPFGAGVATIRPVERTTEAERELRERLTNEDRLVQLASAFVGLPAGEFDAGVNATLLLLGSLKGIMRVSVFRLQHDHLVITHQWAGPGMSRTDVEPMPLAGNPLLERLSSMRETFLDVDDPAVTGQPQVEELRAEGVRNVLSVPIAERGRFAGFISFSSREVGLLRQTSYLSMIRSAAGLLGEAFARHSAEQRLARQARVDLLTGLANRWAFMDGLSDAVERFHDGTLRGFSVLLLDLDRFKVVNDSLGHHAGDMLLAGVAERLQAVADDNELVARFGGDEIIVLLEDRGCAESATARAEVLLAALEHPFLVGTHEFRIGASAGLAVAEPDLDPEELLRRADAAMFRAKDRGRRRIEVFDEALRAQVNERLRQESELQRAVREGELRLWYQPEVQVTTGRIVGVEALIRWQHPERGIVVAGEFIDIAEETGSILEIGEWAITEACRQLGRWQAAGRDLVVRVNLSARQVNQPDLVDRLVEILRETDVDPSRLCLEITETAVMADAELSLEVLGKLAGLGLRLAIDDFGTGYSSLEYLKRFPVHVLKIDRSFIVGVARDPEDAAIVRAILSLAESLSLDVTAEGVETEEQRAGVLALGCELAQGFLFSPAVPVDELEAMLAGPPLPVR